MQQDYPISPPPSSSSAPIYRHDERCTFCQEIKPLLIEENVFYNQGRNKRIAYLCCSDSFHRNTDGYLSCYDNYMQDLGLDGHLIVAGCNGWYAQAYHTIRSIYISCPIFPNITIMMMEGKEEEEGRGGEERRGEEENAQQEEREKIRVKNRQELQQQQRLKLQEELTEKRQVGGGEERKHSRQWPQKKANQSFSCLSALTNKLRQMSKSKSYSKSNSNSNSRTNNNNKNESHPDYYYYYDNGKIIHRQGQESKDYCRNNKGGGMPVEDAVRVAYRISPIVRNYLNAVEKHKSKNPLLKEGDITSLKNPRLHSIVWNMLYNEPLLETVDKENLVFRWNKID